MEGAAWVAASLGVYGRHDEVVMLRWCAYCQHYQGDVEPFDDYSVTHTICADCEARGAFLRPQPASLKPIQAFFSRLARNPLEPGLTASEIVAQGAALGLDPVDLLLGVVQPLLTLIGDRWARAQTTVAEEHRVTALCAAVIQALAANDRHAEALRKHQRPHVLLAAAEGNYHTLGVQILEVILLRNRISTLAVYPGLPAPELVALTQMLRPRVVAMSAALPEQLASAAVVADRLSELPVTERPLIVAGGQAVRGEARPAPSSSLVIVTDPRRLVELASGA